jgi:hypothetical protein
MHVVPQARHFLARHPWVYWAAVLSLAAVVAFTLRRQSSLLEQARDQWETTRNVLVADADLGPGDPIKASSKTLPLAAIPESAIAEVPSGARLSQRVASGEVLVTTDITQAPGPAARAEPGTMVVGLTDPLSGQVAIGMVVQIVAEGIVLAANAVVVETSDEIIFVAVPEGDAPVVAAAAQSGLAALIYLP